MRRTNIVQPAFPNNLSSFISHDHILSQLGAEHWLTLLAHRPRLARCSFETMGELSTVSKEKILATGPIADVAIRILEEYGEIVIAPDFAEETLIEQVEDAMALVVRGEGVGSARVIEAGKKLRVIARCGVGYNNIDIAAATAKNIPVVFTPGAGARAVAEGAMSLMLALCKDLSYWDGQLKAGQLAQ